MLSLDNVQFTYLDTGNELVLSIPSLNFKQGKKYLITGSSGCGKSTLLNVIALLLKPSHGEITMRSDTISSYSKSNKRKYRLENIGYVLQESDLVNYLSVKENIYLPFHIMGISPSDQVQAWFHVLTKRLGIEKLTPSKPENISVGERQRVALCRALITRAPLILADEPTASLDENNRDLVMGVLDEYIKETEATLIMVSHDRSLEQRFDQHLTFNELNRGVSLV